MTKKHFIMIYLPEGLMLAGLAYILTVLLFL